jgi:hypothetical protein
VTPADLATKNEFGARGRLDTSETALLWCKLLLAVRSAGTLEPRQEGNTEVARSVNRRLSFSVGIDE